MILMDFNYIWLSQADTHMLIMHVLMVREDQYANLRLKEEILEK